MNGVGPPLVTPFTESGDVDHDKLAKLVGWVEDRGVDFIVPCGSNGEAELMTVEERAAVVETVVEAASVPILAGTGHPGLNETIQQTELAADAGADAALVVTPFYFGHSQSVLADYYHDLADAVDLPVYLYSVPAYTGTVIEPDTVAELANHDNIAGMKDSTGDIERFQREVNRTDEADFDCLVGSASVLAQALGVGATGGVNALANVAPEGTATIYERHRAGDHDGALAANRDLVELNWATTKGYSIRGLKAAMRLRGAPAGHVRKPHQPATAEEEAHLEELVQAAEKYA